MVGYALFSAWIFFICLAIERRTDKPQQLRDILGIPARVPTVLLAIVSVIPLAQLALVLAYIAQYLEIKGLLGK